MFFFFIYVLLLQNKLTVALETTGIFQQVLHVKLIRKQRIKVRTIDENSNLVSSGRKILKSCDRQGHVTCVWQMRGCWQASPTFSGPRENRYPAKIITDDISPPFSVINRWEHIWNGNVCCFLSERRRICVSWSHFAQQRPFPSVPLESMEEEQPTAMPEDTHTHLLMTVE